MSDIMASIGLSQLKKLINSEQEDNKLQIDM